ncbi:hypothetical protein N9V32_00800 [Candidatus Actinomarina sp.]|nr:hypothetical protein [Candidatus Actinomarina sp.]
MTKKNLFPLGVLGKPHALNGYIYLNHDVYFRKFNLSGLDVFINNEEYKIEDFKTHLKNRYLVKFKDLDSINEIVNFRDQDVLISLSEINNFISNNLPWPGFFVGSQVNTEFYVQNYFYAEELIYLTLKKDSEIIIPYNSDFFEYKENILTLINLDLVQ